MKKVFFFTCLICFFQQVTFGQNKSSKKYQLNKLDSEQTYTTKEFSYQLENTDKGLMITEYKNNELEISVLKYDYDIHIRDVYVDNLIKRTILKNNTFVEMTARGIPSKYSRPNVFKGETIIFERKKDVWHVPQLDIYDSLQRDVIKIQLKKLNLFGGNRLQDFIYPDYMHIGDTFHLENSAVNNFFDFSKVTSAKGIFTLKDVIIENDDTIAVFDVDFTIKGFSENDDLFVDFKGTIKRSISKFYDKDINLIGEFTTDMKEQKMYTKTPCKLHLTRNLY